MPATNFDDVRLSGGDPLSALGFGTPVFTVGAEAGNAINVAVQLKDAAGNNLAVKAPVIVWLSDTAGAVQSATPPSGTVVIGTNGVIVNSFTAKTNLLIITNATGAFDLTVTEAGAKSFFLNVALGSRVFSQGMTFV